jgi:hypothetical protein
MRRKDYGKETPGHTKDIRRDDGDDDGATKQKQKNSPKEHAPKTPHPNSNPKRRKKEKRSKKRASPKAKPKTRKKRLLTTLTPQEIRNQTLHQPILLRHPPLKPHHLHQHILIIPLKAPQPRPELLPVVFKSSNLRLEEVDGGGGVR